jgi:hypothetical protein
MFFEILNNYISPDDDLCFYIYQQKDSGQWKKIDSKARRKKEAIEYINEDGKNNKNKYYLIKPVNDKYYYY